MDIDRNASAGYYFYLESGIMEDWVPAEMGWDTMKVYSRKTGRDPSDKKLSAFTKSLTCGYEKHCEFCDDFIKVGYPYVRFCKIDTADYKEYADEYKLYGWIVEFQ